jgi:hypothetical protein
MKLLELIGKLQEIESKHPGTEVAFQRANNLRNLSFQHSPLFLLALKAETGQGHCLITVGDNPGDAKDYAEFLAIQRENEQRFRN